MCVCCVLCAAKNVALAGVKALTLYDPTPASLGDLSSQFYLTTDDIGKPRAHACHHKLADLNQYVEISVTDVIDEQHLLASKYTVIVAANYPLALQLPLSEFAHKNGILFISAETHGVFGYVCKRPFFNLKKTQFSWTMN